MNEWFRKFASRMAEMVGSPWAFILAVLLIIAWAAAGPYFGWSDSHSLFVNTITTIITFLMVFLIQNTQNRDAKAIHLKLDELIHGVKGARNSLLDLEDLSDEELKKLQEQFQRMREKQNVLGGDIEAVEGELKDREAPQERAAAQ
jgi:low affinity Fe/Cu permease